MDSTCAYHVVASNILSGTTVLGYDLVVYRIDKPKGLSCTEIAGSKLLTQDALAALKKGALTIRNKEDHCIINKSERYYHIAPLPEGIFFVTEQDKAALLEPTRRLDKGVVASGISVVLVFTLTVYFMLIRFTGHRLVSLENSHTVLRKAVLDAGIDSMTQAGTRRYGETVLASAFRAFQEKSVDAIIVLFDVDAFKQINDTYGHSIGDAVLKAIADTVFRSIRKEDVLIRWGGDEFVVIFRSAKDDDMMPLAKRLLQEINALTVEAGSAKINPTVSMGISRFRADDTGYLEAVDRADLAMYRSKNKGGNQSTLLF